MAQNDLLDTPLNNPNQEIKLAESSLKARDTAVQPATRDYFQEAMDVASGNTSAFDNAPISKAENLLRARTEKEKNLALNKTYRDIFEGTTPAQDEFLQGRADEALANKDAFIQDVDNPLKYTANLALTGTSAVTDWVTGIGQVLPSELIDQEAESRHLAEPLAREKELQLLIEQTADPIASSNSIAELEGITALLNAPYDSEMLAQREAAQAAVDAAPEGSWQEKANLAEIDYGLSLAPTNRDFRERAEGNVGGAVATYDFLENVSEVVSSTVNRSDERKVQREVEPYAAEASALWQSGDVVGSVGTIADGIFTVALANPGGALQMFVGSLPQMMAMVNPVTAAPTIVSAYNKHVDTMMANYEEINGERATGEDKEFITIGGASAVMFDFFSDKVAMKGLDLIPVKMIQKATAKLGDVAPKGLKTVTEYTTNIAGRVGGLALQPVQEFVSGAGTELSEQAGVAGGFDGLDTGKIIEQGMIESIALAPVQGVVAIKDVVKSTKRVGTDVKESKIIQSVKEAAQKSLDTINADRLAKRSDPDSAVFKAIKFSQENAESFGEGTVEEAVKYTETLEEMVNAAQKEIEENPGKASPELLSDFQVLLDITSKIETVVNTRMEQGQEIDLETIAVTVEKTVKKGMMAALSPASLDKLKGGVLYSMQIDDSITEEQAKVFIKEGNLDTKERAIAIEYLKRIKNINEVAQDVAEGEGDLFVGAKSYARNVQAAVLSGNTEAANVSLNKFKNFAGYMKVKATVFKNVWQHNYDLAQNKTRTVPKGIEIISQDANGKITEFRITDIAKYGVTTDGVSKVWNSSIDGAIRKLGRQVEKESKVINSYLEQATQAVGATPVKKVNKNVPEDEVNVADQEEYYASLETPTEGVTNEDLGDLIPPTIEETTENPETTETPPWEVDTDQLNEPDVGSNEPNVSPVVEPVAEEAPVEAVSDNVRLNPEVIKRTAVIDKMKESQSKARTDKVAEQYGTRIAQLELELQEIVDTIQAEEAAKLADPKTALDVYDLSKSIFTDEAVELEYLAEVYGQDVEAIYLGSSIWGEEADAKAAKRTLSDVLQPKSAKEIQTEEDIKDNLNSRDLFKTVRNIFGAIKKSTEFLKMTPAQLDTVKTLSGFNTQFTNKAALILRDISDRLTDDQGNYKKITTQYTHDGVQMDRFQENPLNYLLKRISVNGEIKGYLDPNILSMMAMHGMEFMATLASSTIYNDDAAVKSLLGVDSKSRISNKAMVPFRRIGTSKSELANTIGQNIVKQLGLKGTPQADENFEAQLATALGLVTIDIMVEMGLLQPVSINRAALDVDYINQNTNKLVALAEKGESISKEESSEVVNFIRVTTEGKGQREVVRKDIGQLIENYSIKDGSTESSISKVLENLFGINTQKRFPLLKPRTKQENSKYLRTDVQIPAQVRKDLEYAQSIEWRFKPAMVALFSEASRAESIQALKDLVGYKESLDDVPEYFKEAEQAVNDSLLREIEDAVTFFDILAESGQDQFYYSYNSWNNSRSGMNESAVSPQASKIIRHLIYPTDPVTSESFNQELSLSDPFHLQMFKVAIIQSLYPDTKIDKNTLEKINSDFDANLESNRRNPITKAARSINNGTNPIVAANEAGLTGTIGVDGLVALAAYYKAIKEKKETITVDLGIETDATTSGLIISLLNSGRRSASALIKLAAGGAYTTVETNYVNHNLKHDDNYESLANIWKKAIQENELYNLVLAEDAPGKEKTLTGTIGEAVTDLLGWPDRDAAKDPVMQSNYFAADNTLISAYVDASIDALHKKLLDSNESVRLTALESLNNILQYDYTKLGGQKKFNNFRKIPAGMLSEKNYKSFSLDNFQDLKFRVVVSRIYGSSLKTALGEVGSEFGGIGSMLNEAGNAAFYVYKALLDHVTKAVKGTGDQYYISNKQRALIENDPRVKALFPTMRFIDTAEGEGIHAFKRNSARNMDSGNRIIIRYSDAKSNKGVKSTSARITKVEDSAPGVSLVARQIQGLDDASARSVVGQFPVMHMFDAVISPILHSIRNARTYNQGTLDANRDFSIFDNAVEMLSKIVDVMEDPKNTDIRDIILEAAAIEGSPLAELDFTQMLDSAFKMQESIESDKKQLFEEDLIFFDHMGLEGTGVENQFHKDNDTQYENEAQSDVLDAWAESYLETDDPYSGPDPLKSDDGASIDHRNFVDSDSEVLSGDNSVEIFDSLGIGDRQGNSTDTAEHLSYLRELLGNVIAPALNSLGNFSLRMRRAGDSNAGSIQDQEILLNFGVNNGSNILLNQGSERTTYVHELVHAITRFMFDDPKLSPIASEVVKLRERTRKYLNKKYNGEGWKAFMSPDEGVAGHLYDKDAEIAYAKGTYEYIFAQKGQFWTAGNEDKVSARGIHEFVTFGLTDSRLIAELAEMPYKAEREAATTFGGRIQELFLKLVDQIFTRIKKRGNTADKHLIQLVAALNKVDTKSRFNTNMIMKRVTMGDNIAERAFTRYIFTPIAKASLKVTNKVRGQGIVSTVARNAAMVVGASVEGVLDGQVPIEVNGQKVMLNLPFKKALDESRKRLRISKNSLLVYILRTIAGPSNDMDRRVEHMLAKANMLIDQNRKNIAEGVRKHIEDSFLTPMEKKDWEALTLGVLKTDLVSLLPNNTSESIPRLIDLLLNTNNIRTNRIKNIREQLIAMGPIGNHYVQQSRGLGVLMATGKVTVRMQRMNAYMIANSKGVVPGKQMPKDLIATQKLIDQLASLYALENNVSNANANTAAIIQREFKANNRANGITEFIGQAINLKQDALERNFNNDETHTVKGFIKNITNPNISVKIAPLADQKKMREMGYKLVSPLKDDTTSDPSKKAKALYSSDFVTMQDYNRGIMSTTSMKAAGTLLSQMLTVTSGENFTYSNAKNAVKAAVLNNSKEYAKHANNPDYAITDQSVMVPVFDTNQNIVDFRYLMADDTKVNILKQELRSQVLLSSEAGSIEDKVKTSLVNIDALQLLKEDYDANYLKRSDEFVKISLTSGKAKHRELYNLLPTETRQQIKKIFGKDEILIDEKYIDVIFGQRSLSIANLPFLNYRAIKIAEVIWKEIVSMAKKNIVIKTGSVLFHNIISNTVVGILNGVPIEYMLKEQLRTARDLNNYMDVKRNLHVAKATLKSAKGLNDKKAIDDAQDSINSMSTVLNNSPVRELIRRGMFQSITEEIDSESDPYSYASALSDKVDKFAGKNKVLNAVNNSAKAIGRYSYMTNDTSMYKLLLKTTQYSDFVARQAVFKYKTEVEKISKDETENLVRDLFVNYDIPDHQILQYMNETGISMFTKYPMRMLRVIFKMMKGRPIEGVMLIMLEDYMGMNLDDPTDMGFNLLNSPFAIAEDAFTQSGLEMAKEVF